MVRMSSVSVGGKQTWPDSCKSCSMLFLHITSCITLIGFRGNGGTRDAPRVAFMDGDRGTGAGHELLTANVAELALLGAGEADSRFRLGHGGCPSSLPSPFSPELIMRLSVSRTSARKLVRIVGAPRTTCLI